MPLPSRLKGDPNAIALAKLVAGAVMISFSGVWVKISHVPPSASAFYRVFIGGLILLPFALWRGELKRQTGRHLFLALACGFFFALDLILFHTSIQYIGPGLGTILPNFQVFILAIVGVVFFREKLRLISLASMPLAFFGLLMIVGFQWHALDDQYKLGILFGFAAAACYSGVLLLLRKLQSDQVGASTFSALTLVSFTTSFFIALEMLRAGDSFAVPDLQSLLGVLALGLFSQSVGWILITNALPAVRASLSGLILLLQPALSFVWDVLFFQRPTTTLNWLGVVIALTAIYLGTMGRARPAK